MKARAKQLETKLPTWGGKRRGAGRKPKGARAGVTHTPRPVFTRRRPVHVTLRMAEWVWNLRSRRSLKVLESALIHGADRHGVRVVQFSIQGNHIHLLVEAEDSTALARGIQGLSIRIAKGMNSLMKRKGRVLGDRYHARVLKTPTEVRHAAHYIRNNHKHHTREPVRQDPYS